MKKICIPLTFFLFLFLNCAYVSGSIVFSDKFSSTTYDSDKWDLLINGGGSFEVANQQAKFTIKDHSVYLKSKPISITSWESVGFTGQWKIPSTITPEYDIFVYNSDDENEWIRVTYQSWGGPYLWLRDSDGTSEKFDRSAPDTMTDFSLSLTNTGWSYTEDGESWPYSSGHLNAATRFALKIGGWDSSSRSDQIVYFDNIAINAIPEPMTISLLGLGGLLLCKNRKRRQ